MRRIVITDPLPFDEAQLARLNNLGEVTCYSTMPSSEEELISRLLPADATIAGWCNLTRKVLSSCKRLQFVSLWAAGTNLIDLEAAAENQITVATAADYASTAVAEFTLAAILNLTRRVSEANQAMRNGITDWRKFQGYDLNSRTVGVVGCGSIGQLVIRLLKAFHTHVLCYTRTPSNSLADALGISFVDLDSLVQASDIVTIHVPLSPETFHMFNEHRLRIMKPGSFLINTSRGDIVDESALIKLIEEGHLGGAAIDVFSKEPPDLQPFWFSHNNLILTPHIAFNSREAMFRKNDICVSNVENYLLGHPTNIVVYSELVSQQKA